VSKIIVERTIRADWRRAGSFDRSPLGVHPGTRPQPAWCSGLPTRTCTRRPSRPARARSPPRIIVGAPSAVLRAALLGNVGRHGRFPVPSLIIVGLLLGLLPALRRDRRLGLGAVLLLAAAPRRLPAGSRRSRDRAQTGLPLPPRLLEVVPAGGRDPGDSGEARGEDPAEEGDGVGPGVSNAADGPIADNKRRFWGEARVTSTPESNVRLFCRRLGRTLLSGRSPCSTCC